MPSFLLTLSKFGIFTYNVWLTVSSALLLILHFVCSCHLSIFPLITLTRMACSWAANIKLFISRYRVPLPPTTIPYFLSLSQKLATQHLFLPRNCYFFLLLLLSLNCSLSDWLNQVNIQKSCSNKQTLSGPFYIVLQS